jgi:hypothetical protein
VSSSPAFKWLVIALVPLTFGWKLVGGETTTSESKIDTPEFLSHHGFEVTKRTLGDVSFSDATAGACRMIVVEVSPDGWSRDIIRQIVGTTEHQFFVFRGSTYTKQPTWLTISNHLWSRSLRMLGFARRDTPVIAVSATGPCGPEQLPWDELSSSAGETPLPIPG